MPHSIYYARIRLPEGKHRVAFKAFSKQLPHAPNQRQECYVELNKSQTVFQIVNPPLPHRIECLEDRTGVIIEEDKLLSIRLP